MNVKYIFKRIKQELINIKNRNRVYGYIGKNTTISKNTFIDKFSLIGNETFVNTNCMMTKTKVGNYCSIGSNVVLRPGEHDIYRISLSGRFYTDSYNQLTQKDCIIEDDVWIGTYAIVLRGVKVGTGSVIGANSVVTKDVPPFAVVAGIPARIIKYRFDEEKQKKIMESLWYQQDLKTAKKIIGQLENQ